MDYELRHAARFPCQPGRNSFQLDLVGLKATESDHAMELDCLFNYIFTVEGETEDVTLYVDNMRLCPA